MHVTKQVALSDKAYARLRQARLDGESFSQAVERLIENQAKDPVRYLQRISHIPLPGTYEALAARNKAERDATRGPA